MKQTSHTKARRSAVLPSEDVRSVTITNQHPLSVSDYGELAFAEGRSEGYIAGLRAALRVVPNTTEAQSRTVGALMTKIVRARKTHRRKFPLSETKV